LTRQTNPPEIREQENERNAASMATRPTDPANRIPEQIAGKFDFILTTSSLFIINAIVNRRLCHGKNILFVSCSIEILNEEYFILLPN
jgi:hypothetical protein